MTFGATTSTTTTKHTITDTRRSEEDTPTFHVRLWRRGGRPPAQIYSPLPPLGGKWHKTSAHTQEKVQSYLRCDISRLFAVNAIIQLWAVSGKKCTAHFFFHFIRSLLGIWKTRMDFITFGAFDFFENRAQIKLSSYPFIRVEKRISSQKIPIMLFTRWRLIRFWVGIFFSKHVRTFVTIESGNALLSYPNWKQVNSLSISLTMCICSLLLLLSNNRRFHTKQYNCGALKCSLVPQLSTELGTLGTEFEMSRERFCLLLE